VCIDTVPVAGNNSSTTAAAAGTTATASSAAGPATAASSAVSKVLSSEVYTAPQLVALRYLVSLSVSIVLISNSLKLLQCSNKTSFGDRFSYLLLHFF